jgi:hypothetical protein
MTPLCKKYILLIIIFLMQDVNIDLYTVLILSQRRTSDTHHSGITTAIEMEKMSHLNTSYKDS